MGKKVYPCPRCGAGTTIPILWGLPYDMEEALAAVDRGEIMLGGCVVSGNDPTHFCKSCRHAWRDPTVYETVAGA